MGHACVWLELIIRRHVRARVLPRTIPRPHRRSGKDAGQLRPKLPKHAGFLDEAETEDARLYDLPARDRRHGTHREDWIASLPPSLFALWRTGRLQCRSKPQTARSARQAA
ncbi:hypothetical protein ACM42_09295 [Bradyrhizobium sp. CCBAU 25338]|nr:hypothetical protein [Bradyrhizobium sp. CCBAU 25338]